MLQPINDQVVHHIVNYQLYKENSIYCNLSTTKDYCTLPYLDSLENENKKGQRLETGEVCDPSLSL